MRQTNQPWTQVLAFEVPSSVAIDRYQQDADNQEDQIDSKHNIADDSIESFLTIEQSASEECQGNLRQVDNHKK